MQRTLPALLISGVALIGSGFSRTGPQTAPVAHPSPLALGSPAPDFRLPGVDGKTYSLASFARSKVLVVIFTAVHCPTAEVYENRIKQLVADYAPKGVGFVAIQPNSPKGLRLDEMGYTDLGDSLDEMRPRFAALRRSRLEDLPMDNQPPISIADHLFHGNGPAFNRLVRDGNGRLKDDRCCSTAGCLRVDDFECARNHLHP